MSRELHTYRCWEDGDDPADAYESRVLEPERAAENYMESTWDDGNTELRERIIWVQDEEGNVTKFRVTVDFDPVFTAEGL